MIPEGNPQSIADLCFSVEIKQRGVQWKQGVVVYITLLAVLLYNTTPIHCTPLRQRWNKATEFYFNVEVEITTRELATCCVRFIATNIIPTKTAWLKHSGEFPMDLTVPPLESKIMLESNPLKSRILVGRLAVNKAKGPKDQRTNGPHEPGTEGPGCQGAKYTMLYYYII